MVLLNFASNASAPRASNPISDPTATNIQPASSHFLASASTPMTMPAAFPRWVTMRRLGLSSPMQAIASWCGDEEGG